MGLLYEDIESFIIWVSLFASLVIVLWLWAVPIAIGCLFVSDGCRYKLGFTSLIISWNPTAIVLFCGSFADRLWMLGCSKPYSCLKCFLCSVVDSFDIMSRLF